MLVEEPSDDYNNDKKTIAGNDEHRHELRLREFKLNIYGEQEIVHVRG